MLVDLLHPRELLLPPASKDLPEDALTAPHAAAVKRLPEDALAAHVDGDADCNERKQAQQHGKRLDPRQDRLLARAVCRGIVREAAEVVADRHSHGHEQRAQGGDRAQVHAFGDRRRLPGAASR